MTLDYVTNRLHFFSNEKTILAFLKSGSSFSLNTIRPQMESLNLPLNQDIVELSIMNMETPILKDEATAKAALTKIFQGRRAKPTDAQIEARIKEIAPAAQAVSNYRQYGFFSLYDWRFANWGTVEDVHSVTHSTFELPTTFIEFRTRWTPPVPAMQALAEIFPSVRFELEYHLNPEDPWTTVEIFPLRTFAY